MRVALLVVLGLAACGSGLQESRIRGRDALAKAAGDPAALADMLGDPVVNGGVWFDDPGCATQFPPGEIKGDRRAGFARCLAGLHLQPSAREDALGDVVVMTYPPGFELEARVVADPSPLLVWIGFASRRPTDTLPSISGEALEARRLAGDRDGPLDPATAAIVDGEVRFAQLTSATFTWLKVCVDGTGAVTSADGFETTSTKAEAAFAAAAMTWKFRPFVVRDRAIAVCAMTRLAYPARSAPPLETLPMPPPPSRSKRRPVMLAEATAVKLLEGHRVAGTKLVVPDDDTKTEILKARLSKLLGRFRICIDETGAPEMVLPMRSTGFASYDERIIATMRQWRYSPYKVNDEPVPVCTAITFIYTQR